MPTDLETIQSMSRQELERAFSQREKQLADALRQIDMLKNPNIGIDESHLLLAEKVYPGYNWRYRIGEGWLKGEEGRNDSTVLILPSRQHLEETLATPTPDHSNVRGEKIIHKSC